MGFVLYTRERRKIAIAAFLAVPCCRKKERRQIVNAAFQEKEMNQIQDQKTLDNQIQIQNEKNLGKLVPPVTFLQTFSCC